VKPPEGKAGQLRLPWGTFVPSERATVFRPAKLPGKRCPACGCTPDRPCTVVLADGEASCVAAGLLGARTCSSCRQAVFPFSEYPPWAEHVRGRNSPAKP